jgi:hypothetical protein
MLLPQSGRPQEAPWKGVGLGAHQLKSEIRIFKWPSFSHRIDKTYMGPPPELEGLYQTKPRPCSVI